MNMNETLNLSIVVTLGGVFVSIFQTLLSLRLLWLPECVLDISSQPRSGAKSALASLSLQFQGPPVARFRMFTHSIVMLISGVSRFSTHSLAGGRRLKRGDESAG